jgi:lipopolysaccharide/colanic/teichoic acid biosynthesis glycosyltransferase
MAKRIFDLFVSAILLIIALPILIAVSLLVFVILKRPVFFAQVRPGKDCEPFKMYKFRTMTNDTDEAGNLLPNEIRMTSFGLFLRRSSLDELPELYNVLIGDMSLVGPRPLLMDYVPLFNEFQIRRHEVKPGITGWAQVNGRNSISWEEKFELDIWYVEHCSFLLDLKILWLTLIKTLRREGISYEGDVAMPRFKGNIID